MQKQTAFEKNAKGEKMTEIKKVAVLGAGNGGFMCAADMGNQGYEVALYSRDASRIQGVKEKEG